MPHSHPDLESLRHTAKMTGFREPLPEESEVHFRDQLADYMEPKDPIWACEIRNKVGWDEFSEKQNLDMLRRQFRKVREGEG